MKSKDLFFATLPLILFWVFCIVNSTTRFINNSNAVKKYLYEQKTIRLPVDHFSFANNDTFELRYLVNDSWRIGDNRPIFFYTGNEDNIEVFARNSGFMWDIAPEFQAILIFAEHRYYGESMPYGNKSFSEPKYSGYLTSQQTLADYVDLIYFLKKDVHLKESPVIAFGGFYGSMPSAWIQMKYPHVIHGAITSSVPIFYLYGIKNCSLLSKITTAEFESVSPVCLFLIRRSQRVIRKFTYTDEGRKWLHKNWFLCKPMSAETALSYLTSYLDYVYLTLASFNYPYETNLIRPLGANPLWRFCSRLLSEKLDDKDLLLALYQAVSSFANYTGKMDCLSLHEPNFAIFQDNLGSKYQFCTEMFTETCAYKKSIIFNTGFTNKMISDQCYKKFGVRLHSNMIYKTYGRSSLFGTTNTIFSQVLRDPWSGTGFAKIFSTSVETVIPEGVHHFDLQASRPRDPFSVIEARKFYVSSIKEWISQYRKNLKGTPLV